MPEDTARKSLSRNTLWSLIGHITNGTGRLLLFLLAAKYFDPTQMGIFSWSLAVVTPIIYLFNLELRLSYVTDTAERYSAGDMVAMRLIGNGIALGIIAIIAAFMARYDSGLTALLLILCGLTRGTECFADSYIGILQKNEKMRQAAISYICRTAIVISAVLVVGSYKWPIWTIPLIWTGAVIILNRGYESATVRKIVPIELRFDKKQLRRIFIESVPLGIFMAIASLNAETGKYFIKNALGNSYVAYYTIAIIIVNGCMMTQNGINQGVLQRLSQYYQSNRPKFLKLLAKLLLLSTIFMLAIITIFYLFGRSIIATISQEDYAAALYDNAPVMLIMLLGGLLIVWAMVIGDAVVACREFAGRMTSMMVSLVINFTLCYYLTIIKQMGLTGVAWSFFGSAVANLVVNFIYLVKLIRK